MEGTSTQRSTDSWNDVSAATATIGTAAVELDNVIGITGDDADDGTDASSDGRTLRRRRNREAVIVALLDIIREGSLEPSVADIADRAGVSHRSVFRYFDDLNDLVRTAIDYEVRNAVKLSAIKNPGVGTLAVRVDAYVDSRLRTLAATHQVGRVARLKSASIPAIDEELSVVGELLRIKMRDQFEPELLALEESEAEFRLDAAMVLTSFEAFDLQRRIQGHGTERIRTVWNSALRSLLTN